MLGAAAAALISAGLMFWIGRSEDPTLAVHKARTPAVAPRAYAPSRPDAEQVVRAYDQLQEVYADQGLAGVTTFARGCADQLKSDPEMLDFCLAFDIYGATLEGDDEAARAWQATAGARELAWASAALAPGQDAAAHLAVVRELTREAAQEPPAPAPAPRPPLPSAGKPAHPARVRAVAACRLHAAPAQRLVCASPALRDADRRMRRAYRQALAAGADPRKLAHDQARWRAAVNAAPANRAAVAKLYHRRTLALQIQARRMRSRVD